MGSSRAGAAPRLAGWAGEAQQPLSVCRQLETLRVNTREPRLCLLALHNQEQNKKIPEHRAQELLQPRRNVACFLLLSGSPPGHGGEQQGLGALSPPAMQALVRARQWRHCYYTWPHSPFKALEDELCFIYIKEAISEPICDQICCQRNFALSHYI